MKDTHREWPLSGGRRHADYLGVSSSHARVGTGQGRARTKAQGVGNMSGAESPPEGPCGFEPLHLDTKHCLETIDWIRDIIKGMA